MKVSFVMPTFKHHEFISESIKSILSQTYSDFELIVVPVIEDTKTIKILNSMKDNRLKVIPSNFALITHQMNLGILSAKGEYFMMFASDDFLYKDSLEKTLNFAIKKNAVVTYPNYHVGNQRLDIRRLYRAKEFSKRTLFKGNYITDVSLIKKDAFMKYFPMKVSDGKSRIYNVYKALAEDKEYSFRIFHYNRPTFIYRQHSNSVHLKEKSQRKFQAVELICSDAPAVSSLPRKYLSKLKKPDFAVYLNSPIDYIKNTSAFKYKKVITRWRNGDMGMFNSNLFHRVYNIVDSDCILFEMASLGTRHIIKEAEWDLNQYVVEDNLRDLSVEAY